MKKLTFLFIVTSIAFYVSAQTPQGFNYQAVVRDVNGQPLAEQEVSLRITLQHDSGTPVHFVETHTQTTSPQGLVSLTVGSGTVVSGVFDEIPWSQTNISLKVEADIEGETEYALLGITKLQTVPYAQYALSSKEQITAGTEGQTIRHGNDSWEATDDIFIDSDNNVGIGTISPSEKLEVAGNVLANQFIVPKPEGYDDLLFAVRNSNDEIVFAVYESGVRIYVDEDAQEGSTKSTRSGFAIGGLTEVGKEDGPYLLQVNRDGTTVRFDEDASKSTRSGFAIGGLTDVGKEIKNEYLAVTPTSTMVKFDKNANKSSRSGFAIGGLSDIDKEETPNYFNISPSSDEIIDPSEPRILWYPLKNAFLAGQVLIESVDDVGENSMAIGYETKASGPFSQAMGYRTQALGTNSTAIGNQAVAQNNNSLAIGDAAKAQNLDAYAIGSGAIASGQGSYAIGSVERDTIEFEPTGYFTQASGDYSFAIGQGAFASNTLAISIGNNSIASGTSSVALGTAARATNTRSQSLGFQSVSSGYAATAIGFRCDAEGGLSFSAGYKSKTSEYAAVALGSECEAIGRYSTAIGHKATAEGMYSTAIGRSVNSIGGNDIAIGLHVTADGGKSMALGNTCSTNGMQGAVVFNTVEGKDELLATENYQMNFKAENGFRFFAHAQMIEQNSLVFPSTGNIGVGTFLPTQKLDIQGNAKFREVGSLASSNAPLYITAEGVLSRASSDRRLKTNIESFDNALTLVRQLRGVKFNWINDENPKSNIGFIAQEVEQVLPEVVFTNEVDGFMGINYAEITSVLVEAIKEQQQIIEELQNHKDHQAKENADLKARLERIEQMLLER